MDPKSNDSNKVAVRRVQEQQVQVPSSGDEVRKGVNVLTTSNPKNAAPNPFVQGQNQSTPPGQQSNPGAESEGKQTNQ